MIKYNFNREKWYKKAGEQFEFKATKKYSFTRADFELGLQKYFEMDNWNELEGYFKNFNDFLEDFFNYIFKCNDIDDIYFDDLDKNNKNKFKEIVKSYVNDLPNAIIELMKEEEKI